MSTIKCIFLTVILIIPIAADAAKVSLAPATSTIVVSGELQVDVMLDPTPDSVNAIEGKIVLSPGLKVTDITTGKSIVSLWIETPKQVDREIGFAGLIPGGVRQSAQLFSFIVRAESEGQARITAADIVALSNDGKGTALPVIGGESIISVKSTGAVTVSSVKDNRPPEPFTIARNRSEAIFNNQPFIVFSAVDKESGIDHYEISRGIMHSRWELVTSPYPLEDMSFGGIIRVKAVDRAGNEYVAQYTPWSAYPVRSFLLVLCMVLLVIVLIKRRFSHYE